MGTHKCLGTHEQMKVGKSTDKKPCTVAVITQLLTQLDFQNLVIRRQNLMLKFAKNGIETGKLKELFQHRKTTNNIELRNPDKF